MEKITMPTKAVIDFVSNPKLAQAVENFINAANEKELTPRYTSAAEFIIEAVEEKLKGSVAHDKKENN